jgi:nucleoside-diphosphate-sugar epimerase
MNNVLITGANGFIGKHLCERLIENGNKVTTANRSSSSRINNNSLRQIVVGSIDNTTNWHDALLGVDCVIHLAARVHVMKETMNDPLSEFRTVNLHGTLRLAQQAVAAGIKRFIYVSSVKVHGEATIGKPFCANDELAPVDPYGISKAEAEEQLFELARASGLEMVVIRPPLVYGPGVSGNFLKLLRIVERSLPLPLASIKNARSMVSISNLTDLLARCLVHPRATGESFLVSDGVAWSTPELIRAIAKYMDVPTRLFPMPPKLLKFAGHITGRANAINRLCDSLEVDIRKTCEYLDWSPSQTATEGIQNVVEWYMNRHND